MRSYLEEYVALFRSYLLLEAFMTRRDHSSRAVKGHYTRMDLPRQTTRMLNPAANSTLLEY